MTQARIAKKKSEDAADRAEVRQSEISQQHPLLHLQQAVGNRAVLDLLTSRVAGPMVQRKCADCSPGAKCASCEEEDERIQRKSVSETMTTASGLIVADDAANVAPNQMRKSEFLEQLRSTVCTTADEALKEAGQSTEGCPYIERWLAYYTDQEPAHIERALRKYAPEAASATSARDYFPAINNRVRRAVDTWARTGEVTGVPDELAGMLPGAGLLGMLGGAVSAIGSAIGGAFSSIGNALFKRKTGQAESTDNPRDIQAELSGGRPLDATIGSRMGAAFGVDFSGVRVHTGSQAAGLSDQLNARAFTIGSDIAFGAGEYQPGTLIGDALIAHELAHVVQQKGSSEAAPMNKGATESSSLENEADEAAVGAVASLWGNKVGALKQLGHAAMPRLKSGLRLQSCGGPEPAPKTPYEKLVVEATQKLMDPRAEFGFPFELLGENCDVATAAKEPKFDTRYWKAEKVSDKECMLVNAGKASAAIDAIFDEKNRSKWNFDCRIFSELPQWYAMLHTLGAEKFDEKFPRIELKRRDITGLKTTAYWFEETPKGGMLIEAKIREDTGQGPVEVPFGSNMEPVPKDDTKARPEAEVAAEAPVGSRVTFGTYDVSGKVHRDNTVKMAKDLYAAHDVPVGKDAIYTREEIAEALRMRYNPYGAIPANNVRIVAIEIYDVKEMTK